MNNTSLNFPGKHVDTFLCTQCVCKSQNPSRQLQQGIFAVGFFFVRRLADWCFSIKRRKRCFWQPNLNRPFWDGEWLFVQGLSTDRWKQAAWPCGFGRGEGLSKWSTKLPESWGHDEAVLLLSKWWWIKLWSYWGKLPQPGLSPSWQESSRSKKGSNEATKQRKTRSPFLHLTPSRKDIMSRPNSGECGIDDFNQMAFHPYL